VLSRKENKPWEAVCPFDPLLPIKVVEEKEKEMQPGRYHAGVFLKVVEGRAVVRLDHELGAFENYAVLAKVLGEFCKPFYQLSPKTRAPLKGDIKVMDNRDKMLKSSERPFFL
jgi:hypothetical protein